MKQGEPGKGKPKKIDICHRTESGRKEMYTKLKLKGFGNFFRANYWSSTENTIFLAWSQDFHDGVQRRGSKASGLRVRAVRAF